MSMKKPWTEAELKNLVKCLETSLSFKDAVAKHNSNKRWKTGRSLSACESKLTTNGMRSSQYLGNKVKMDDVGFKAGKISKEEFDKNLQVTRLKLEVANLRSEMKVAKDRAMSSDKLIELIDGVKDVHFNKSPDWMEGKSKGKKNAGIPVLFFSDVHFDEVVQKAQVNNSNEYNHKIAIDRIHFTFNKAVDLLHNYMTKPSYDGIVIALGGDIVSGNIHEELAETNEGPILQTVIDVAEVFVQGIKGMADIFGKVYVPCVVGNHGRLHKKPRMKNAIKENYEYMIYHLIKKEFRDDPRVTVHVPEGWDAIFKIYNLTFCLTHGDQFKGGTGIAGLFSPLMLGLARKQKLYQAQGMPFDIMMLGHFHQYIHMEQMIVNGSVKGYDTYAMKYNFPFERPKQALFIVHPQYGITYRMPVICDAYLDSGKKYTGKNEFVEIIND